MGYMDEKYPMWFIYDYYVCAGRTKAEDIQMDLERYCMKIREENKRLAPVKIYVTEKRQRKDGIAWLYIGAQHLRIRRVVNTIEY